MTDLNPCPMGSVRRTAML